MEKSGLISVKPDIRGTNTHLCALVASRLRKWAISSRSATPSKVRDVSHASLGSVSDLGNSIVNLPIHRR